MANSKYYYNAETCHYERDRVTFWKSFQYIAGVLVTGSFIFIILVFASDRLTETNLEKALRLENKALRKHKTILTAELSGIETSLAELRNQDKLIHEKLFDIEGTDFGENKIQDNKSIEIAHDVLLSDEEVFHVKLNEIATNTRKLTERSAKGNEFFGNHFHLEAEDALALQAVPTLMPIQGSDLMRLASGFGTRINPFHKGKYMHEAIDFTAPRGTTIVATAPGKITSVKLSSLQAGYGNYISINHGNGFVTLYAHLDEIAVRRGERVSKGQVIGTVGNSGGSIVPHLHYEVIQNGEHVDPLTFIIEGVNSLEYNQLRSISSKQNQSLD